MLYFASYFYPNHQHGLKLSISRSIPKDFKVNGSLQFLIPHSELLADWKAKRVNAAEYTQRYREQIKHSWSKVNDWLNSLESQPTATLLCWEKPGDFCHRQLVSKLVQKRRPDCFGGCDVVRYEPERCLECNNVMICGLDFSKCRNCNKWWHRSLLERKITLSKGK